MTADVAPNPSISIRALVPPLPAQHVMRWQRGYRLALVLADAAGVLFAGALSELLRLNRLVPRSPDQGRYALFVICFSGIWIAMVTISGGYDRQVLGHGMDEYKRSLNALGRFTALTAGFVLLTEADVDRLSFVIFIATLAMAAPLSRSLLRVILGRLREQGRAMRNVLIVGTPGSAFPMASRMLRGNAAGYRVVGLCTAGGTDRRDNGDWHRPPARVPRQDERRKQPHLPPVLGSFSDVRTLVQAGDIDTVAVSQSSALTPEAFRQLTWELEDTGVEIIVAPALIDVAGPRIQVTPVAGLPLLYVSTPRFTGARRAVKTAQDLILASLALVCLAPLFAIIRLLIRHGSPGRVFCFRSESARAVSPSR